MRTLATILLCATVLGACYSNDNEESTVPSSLPTHAESAPEFGVGTALLDNGEETELIDIEVADSDEQRQYGLMFQESMPDRYGMAFIFFEESTGGFYMKNTLIPLSIAFFDKDGQILKILDMKPCESDPCEIYDPGVSYWGALEVKQGMFAEWDIEAGDKISIQQ